jgi:phosphatidylglycerophosphate synthase
MDMPFSPNPALPSSGAAPAGKTFPAPAILAVGAALTLAVTALPLPVGAGLVAMAVYGLVAAAVAANIRAHPHPRFGIANTLTLIRAAGASLFAGFVAAPEIAAGTGAWWAAGAAAALLALDGVDGWAAGRQGLASAFGARFDMEVDALFILVLSALLLGMGKAEPWILAIGTMRYAFVVAGAIWPRLARPLPASLRRKTICVLQVLVLIGLLVPVVAPPVSHMLALAALAVLAASFATDLRWLLRSGA